MLAFLILYIYSNLFYRCIVKFNRNFALLFFLLKGGAQLLWLPRKNTTTTTTAHNTSGICKHLSSNNNNKNKVKTVVFIFRANKMRQSKIKAANGGAQMWQCVYFCQYTDLSRKHWESHALSTGDSLSEMLEFRYKKYGYFRVFSGVHENLANMRNILFYTVATIQRARKQ